MKTDTWANSPVHEKIQAAGLEDCEINAESGADASTSSSSVVGYWTPVTEAMPDDEITVLVWCEGLDDATLAFHDTAELEKRGGKQNPSASGWIMAGTSRVLLGVTHWCGDICAPNAKGDAPGTIGKP